MYMVIGASGLVGGHILEELKRQEIDCCGTYCSSYKPNLLQLDIELQLQVNNLINAIRPKAIFMPAANANVDFSEKNEKAAFITNVLGPKYIADASAKVNSRLVYISSDYVFSGIGGPYSTTELPNPINLYGNHKLQAEHYVMSASPKNIVIRTCGVFGWNHGKGNNFAAHLIESVTKNKEVLAYSDQLGTPTFAGDLAKSIIRYERACANDSARKRLAHITNNTQLSRYNFAIKLLNQSIKAKLFSKKTLKLIKKINSKDFPQPATRPLNAGLKSSVEMPSLDSAIEKFVSNVRSFDISPQNSA